ncbi:MAG: YfiR family protein [Gammaproteobacteria bacterium]|nr:YfiR family protein [Gammaproteobacteria bacterium]
MASIIRRQRSLCLQRAAFRFLFGIFCLITVCAPSAHAERLAAPQYRIKAVLIYNLARMTEWPKTRFAEMSSPMIICFIGEDPFDTAALEIILNKKIRNRPLAFKKDVTLKEISQCHILFVSQSEQANFEDVFAATKEFSILTVGDTEQFAERGGMVNLVQGTKKIGIEVNLSSTESAGLKFSPVLLKLAKLVK